MAEQSYLVHSTVRRRSTRHKRIASPLRHRFVQRLAGGEIIVRRNRPATVTAKKLAEHLEVIKQAEEEVFAAHPDSLGVKFYGITEDYIVVQWVDKDGYVRAEKVER